MVVLCVAPFFLPPDVSISGVLKNLRLLKPGMSVERVISIANASGGFSGLKHAEKFASYGLLLCLYERGE
ncbi:FIG00638775: hypothetical protein [Escherichia coli ISC41]|nr:FIG00638775: hypothetical protein [Escherichia coli ISC41]